MALAGCSRPANSAYSDLPLVSAADAATAPPLHDGVWLRSERAAKPCKIDTARPVAEWPDCANWFVVKGSDLSNLVLTFSDEDGSPAWGWTREQFLLAGGEPRIFQRQWRAGTFWYRAAAALSLGDQGAVVAYKEVDIDCRDPVLKPAGPSADPAKPVEDDCRFDARDKLLARAKKSVASAGNDGAISQQHWVRDITDADMASIKAKPVPPPQAPEAPAKPASKPAA